MFKTQINCVNQVLKSWFINLWKQGKLITRIYDLEAENSKQDVNTLHLKSQISNLELILPTKLVSNDATNPSTSKNVGQSSRVLSGPPTSCQELKDNNGLVPMDGIHLIKNKGSRKIEAVFCMFPSSANPIPSSKINLKYLYNII